MSDEKIERMFGCDPKSFLEELRGPLNQVGLTMVLMSLMSDVQEMVVANRAEDARQALNRAKYLVAEMMPATHGAPADVSVNAELADLKALHSTTTDGTWHSLPGRALAISGTVSHTGYQGFDEIARRIPLSPDSGLVGRRLIADVVFHNSHVRTADGEQGVSRFP